MIKIYNSDLIHKKDRQKILKRSQIDVEKIGVKVSRWIKRFEKEGDLAILKYIRKFDDPNFKLNRLKVSREDIKEAYNRTDPYVIKKIREQIKISKKYHESQAKHIKKFWQIESVPGVITGAKKVPIDSAGLYVPAGKAPLPTVAQILTIAAKVAKVPRRVVCFPPTKDHFEIIIAANEAGATEIYRVGGIAAIASMALGTKTIEKVDKIVGPGNPYVQASKLQLVNKVGIDMLSGPSEVLIIADDTANPKYISSDMLACCEHGPDSASVLITTSKRLAEKTKQEIILQFKKLKRKAYIKKSLSQYSAIIVFKKRSEMIKFANEYSAEHLQIITKNSNKDFSEIRNAGSIFIGNFSPVSAGDYASGTNHCLPTGISPKFSSPVGVETFTKTIEFQKINKKGLERLEPIITTISDIEGLGGHKNSVIKRLEDTLYMLIGNKIKIPKKTKAILWDMDGVLIDSLRLDLNICNKILKRKFGLKVSISSKYIRSIFAYEVPLFWKKILDKVCKKFNLKCSNRIYREIVEEYLNIRQKEVFRLNNGIKEILLDIKKKGIKQAVVSNNPEKEIREILNNCSINKYFNTIIGNNREDKGKKLNNKPCPDYYLLAAKKLGVSSHECVVIEDSLVGAEAGKRARCFTIGVATGSSTKKELEKSSNIDITYKNFK